MSHLLDTNVISELIKPQPEPAVLRFIARLDVTFYLSVITLAELRLGVALLPEGRRRSAFDQWLSVDLPNQFAGRILMVDQTVAQAWGDLTALSERRGTNIKAMDAMLAATSVAHNLILVTRNIRDFAKLDLALLNPWDES